MSIRTRMEKNPQDNCESIFRSGPVRSRLEAGAITRSVAGWEHPDTGVAHDVSQSQRVRKKLRELRRGGNAAIRRTAYLNVRQPIRRTGAPSAWR